MISGGTQFRPALRGTLTVINPDYARMLRRSGTNAVICPPAGSGPTSGESSVQPGPIRDPFERRTGLMVADFAALARVPLFAGLPPAQLRELLAETWVQVFPRGIILFNQDEPAGRFFIVLDGWVKLYRATVDGDVSVIAVLTQGESFAEAAIFDQGHYPVAATPVEDTRLLVVPATPFLRRLKENNELALKMLAAMSRHLRRLVVHVEQLTVKSATERVAEFLVRLCPTSSGGAVIRLPLDKMLIAGRLGMQPETFSRALAKLRACGVNSTGGEVTVTDVAALRRQSTKSVASAARR